MDTSGMRIHERIVWKIQQLCVCQKFQFLIQTVFNPPPFASFSSNFTFHKYTTCPDLVDYFAAFYLKTFSNYYNEKCHGETIRFTKKNIG